MMFWQQRWWIRSKIQATNPALVKDSRNEKSGQRFEKNPPFRPLQTLPSGTAGVRLRAFCGASAHRSQHLRGTGARHPLADGRRFLAGRGGG